MDPDDLRDGWKPIPDPSRRGRVWAEVERGLEQRQRRPRWGWIAAPLAAAAVAAIAWFATSAGKSPWRGDSIITAETESVARLEDGSVITVLRDSSLERCQDTPGCFAVTRGAAEFKVAKQHQRFRVRALGVEVRVVGTRFKVARHDDLVDVSVTEGRVEVARGGVVIKTLGPGERWNSAIPGATGAEPTAASEADAGTPIEDAGANRDDAGPADASGPVIGGMNPPAGAIASLNASSESEPGGPRRESAPPPTADALWSRALSAKLSDDLALEELSYRQLVTRHPRDARVGRASFELARLSMDVRKSPADAVRWLQLAIERGPRESYAEDAWARLARASGAIGKTELCRQAKDTYLAQYPRGVHQAAVREACP